MPPRPAISTILAAAVHDVRRVFNIMFSTHHIDIYMYMYT